MFKLKSSNIFLLVIALLVLWTGVQYINLHSERSRATVMPPVQIGFFTDKLVLQKNQPVSIDVFIQTDARISAATISMQYPTDTFEYINPKDTNDMSRSCASYPNLKSFVGAKDNADQGLVSVTRVSIMKTDDLPKGYFCFGTLNFRSKKDITLPISGVFKMDMSVGSWQITGPQNPSYSAFVIPEKSKLLVTIDSSCSVKSRGDANCDGIIDLGDFEMWRKVFTNKSSYSEAVDFDGDKKNTIKDFEVWRQGFYNSQGATLTPTSTCLPPPPYCMADGHCIYPTMPPGGWCPTPSPTCIPVPPCMLPGANPQCAIKPPPGGWLCPFPSTNPSAHPTIIVDECTWCGTSCVNGPLPPDTMCPMVMPAPGTICARSNGQCTIIKLTLTPTPANTSPTPKIVCKWCGSICTSSENLIACPSITPPAGTTCVQIQNDCQVIAQ